MAQPSPSRLTARSHTQGKTLSIEFLNTNLPLDVHRSPTPQQVRVHDHANFIEIVLVTQGSAIHHWAKPPKCSRRVISFALHPKNLTDTPTLTTSKSSIAVSIPTSSPHTKILSPRNYRQKAKSS